MGPDFAKLNELKDAFCKEVDAISDGQVTIVLDAALWNSPACSVDEPYKQMHINMKSTDTLAQFRYSQYPDGLSICIFYPATRTAVFEPSEVHPAAVLFVALAGQKLAVVSSSPTTAMDE